MVAYNSSLARIFSVNTIKDLVKSNRPEKVFSILKETNNLDLLYENYTLADFFNKIYDILLKNYRGEYVYKNSIVLRHLLGKHSLNTSFVIPELRAVNCKADMVLFNGTSTVYEIKSEYDTTKRIGRQLEAYSKVFDKSYIITTEKSLKNIEKFIDIHVGILLLTDKEYISVVKEAISMKNRLHQEDIFNVLTKTEYLEIIKKYNGFIPEVPNTKIYIESLKLFKKLSPEVAHDEMVLALKKRGSSQILKDFILNVPDSLKALSISTRITNNERKIFTELLNENVSDTIRK
ncbi:MAG: sce7726 family protein [Spirochaetales bacterium]|nr:sce7726 family protein [Spirochaetales bacterium]